jgi:hypothetical protein
MTDTQETIPGVPNVITNDVMDMIEAISQVVEGKRADVALTAMVSMIGGALTGPIFNQEQKKAGSLYLLALASKITADLGISGEEIMNALGSGNAKNQPV